MSAWMRVTIIPRRAPLARGGRCVCRAAPPNLPNPPLGPGPVLRTQPRNSDYVVYSPSRKYLYTLHASASARQQVLPWAMVQSYSWVTTIFGGGGGGGPARPCAVSSSSSLSSPMSNNSSRSSHTSDSLVAFGIEGRFGVVGLVGEAKGVWCRGRSWVPPVSSSSSSSDGMDWVSSGRYRLWIWRRDVLNGRNG